MKRILIPLALNLSGCTSWAMNFVDIPVGPGKFSYVADETYKQKDLEDLEKAQAIINEVIHTPCFKDYFLNPKTRSKLVQTEGRSREQVVRHIQQTNIELPVSMYYTPKKIIGYRNPPHPVIYTNSKYHRSSKFSVCSKASNILHESVHVLGYIHDFRPTSRRPYSVPYTAGYALDHCMKNNKLCK